MKKAQTGRFFAPDKLKSHIRKGKSEEEERRRREKAMLAFLIFVLATLWLWFDRRGLFGGNVFKNPAGYIFIADEKPTMYETAQEYSLLISVTHNSCILSNLYSLADHALRSPFLVKRSLLSGMIFVAALNCLPVSSHANGGKGSTARDVICTFTSLLKETTL